MWVVTVGVTPRQADVFRSTTGFVGDAVADDSVWSVLHRECHVLFPDEAFADLFQATGRRSVPPRIVAVVMVLQRFLGMSDREAVSAFQFDARWKYACGGLDFDYPGFAHTVLVDMRSRLARSAAPDRIFEVTLGVAREAGLVGWKRVMDSAPIYDAVSTQDTVTMIRSAIRGLLEAASPAWKASCGLSLSVMMITRPRGNRFGIGTTPTTGPCWSTRSRSTPTHVSIWWTARNSPGPVVQAAGLLATVVGQDLETDDDGRFVIAWRVAKDRVISTVDPDARHGHKTAARSFDGYKGHIAEDPDSEIITATIVTPGNVGDAAVANDLIDDILPTDTDTDTDTGDSDSDGDGDGDGDEEVEVPVVYGDSAYGTGGMQQALTDAGVESRCRTQQPVNRNGRFSESQVQHRPRRRHSHLPKQRDRHDPSQQRRHQRDRRARCRVWRVSAA